MRDLQVGLRLLWKDKAFTFTSAATLAICIGANVALFAVVDHVLLTPLRVPDADRILLVYNSYPNVGVDHAGASVPDYLDRLRDLTVFDEQALFNTRDPSLDISGTPTRIHTMYVTPSFFRLVRVPPRLGRGFTNDEGELGNTRSVILTHALSTQLFGGAEALGHDVRIDGEPYRVVGVMPPSFAFIDSHVQAWLPLAFTDAQKTAPYNNSWTYLGRLKPTASLAQTQAEVDAIGTANLIRFPERKAFLMNADYHVVAVGLQADLVRDVRSSLYLLWGGALFVLLIGCVNVASLVLVRSRVRLKEFATRLALGANQWHLIRQLTTEYVLLTMVAALGGLGIGSSTLRVLRALNLELPRFAEIQIDGMVIVSTLLVAAAVGVLLGAIPVVGGLTVNLTTSLNSEGRGGSIGRGARAQGRALVVTQVAVAFVLLICAGLLLASFRRVLAVDPGFNPDAVLTASVNLPGSRYPDDASVRRFTDDALRAIRSTAGVVAAGTTTSIPFGDNFAESGLLAEGYHMRTSESLIAPYEVWASPGFFETMQMRLVQGRLFNDHDTADAPSVVIIDEKLAHRFWPDANPVGHRMYEPSDNPDPTAITARTVWHTVIGVVKEVKLRGLVEGVGEVGAYYYPQAQRPPRSLTFAIRTATAHSSVASALRSEIATIDPELPVFDVQTMTDRTDRSLVSQRTAVLLATAFGFVALLLSAIGIYGMLAYLVTQRTKEIGIRMALGSSTSAVFLLVLREGVWLMVGGFVLGTSGAMAISHSLEHQLFGVHVSDPVVLLLAILPLALVGLIACVLPANRASRISPIVALSE